MTYTTPANARFLADLSPSMSTGLARCHTQIVMVIKDTQERPVETKGIATPTIRALVRHDLVHERHARTTRGLVWKPTANGLRIVLAEEPRFLASSSDAIYTSEPGRAMFPDAGEAVDAGWQDRFTAEAVSEGVSRLSERSIAWEWERALRAAEAAGVDVTRERLAIQRRIRAVQRKADQRAA